MKINRASSGLNRQGMSASLVIGVVLIGHSLPLSYADVIYDSLCITESEGYGVTYNHCGGALIWDREVDVQAADDFVVMNSVFVTRLWADYVCFYDLDPESVAVQLYPASSCRQQDIALEALFGFQIGSQDLELSSFESGVFGGFGRRVSIALDPVLHIPAGRWYLNLQPASPDLYCQVATSSILDNCYDGLCQFVSRDGGESNAFCDGGEILGRFDWFSNEPERSTLAMRIEGIPAGDCMGGERVRAKCKVRDGEKVGDVVVKVRGGQAGGTVTALLDPPGPRDIRISLDDRGRGKGKFKDVALGEHRVFVCDSIVDVACAP